MTVLKDKMLVRFEFSEDGTQVINQTEFFNYEWGRLRDICVSPDGKIYLATNGSSWPSQPPNEIIELSNANFNTSSINNFSLSNNIKVIKAEGKINIESPKCNVSIFDSTGKLIFQEKNHKNSSISIKHLSTGLYNILFTNNSESKVVKLIL